MIIIMKKIAWIGVGVMGRSMAGHLARSGYDVRVYNRTFEKAKSLEDEIGVKACASIGQAVTDADYIFSIVGYPKDVEEIYLGDDGIIKQAKKGALAVDMTTSSPALANELYHKGKEYGVRIMDTPVSGGDTGAKNATLSIMAGGDKEDFDEILPLFSIMGKNINYMGGAGSGQHTKAANQIALAGATAAMIEAIVYAKKVGLNPEKMLSAIASGAAGSWQITNSAPRVLSNDFAPGFFIKHFVKDMEIVKKEADSCGVKLEVLETVLGLYRDMVSLGYENDGTQGLIQRYLK